MLSFERVKELYPLDKTWICQWFCDSSFTFKKSSKSINFSTMKEPPFQDTENMLNFVKYISDEHCYEEWCCWKLNFNGYFIDKNDNLVLTTYSEDFGLELFDPSNFNTKEYSMCVVDESKNLKHQIARTYFDHNDFIIYNLEDLMRTIEKFEKISVE